MGLRSLAAQDLANILQDDVYGFGWSIQVTDPSGKSAPLTGFSSDISQALDPGTGELISGRFTSVLLLIPALTAAGLALPQGIADTTEKPWLITFDDIGGTSWTFAVRETNPDRTFGNVVCILQDWQP